MTLPGFATAQHGSDPDRKAAFITNETAVGMASLLDLVDVGALLLKFNPNKTGNSWLNHFGYRFDTQFQPLSLQSNYRSTIGFGTLAEVSASGKFSPVMDTSWKIDAWKGEVGCRVRRFVSSEKIDVLRFNRLPIALFLSEKCISPDLYILWTLTKLSVDHQSTDSPQLGFLLRSVSSAWP